MEAGRRRIVVKLLRKCICQVARRVDVACQHVRHSQTAFHPSLPGKKGALNPVIVSEPLAVDHPTDVQDRNHLREERCDTSNQLFLSIRQVEITIREDLRRKVKHPLFGRIEPVGIILVHDGPAVPALPGEPADGNNRCICMLPCLLKKRLRKLRLHRHARLSSGLQLLSDVLLVELRQLSKDLYFSFLLLEPHPVAQIPDIRACHITGSSAALDIVS